MGTPIYHSMLAATQPRRGLDYSAGRIPGAQILQAGYQFVIRYVDAPGSTNRKLITPDEYRDLRAAGVDVLLVFEQDITDALGGFDQGVANAERAKAGADALGYQGLIFFCSDMHLTHSQLPTALAYLDGAASVLGRERVGAYGFWEFVDAAAAAGKAAAYWQCGIAPDPTDPIHIWQRNDRTTTVAGIECDINELLRPLPTPEEEGDLSEADRAKLDLIISRLDQILGFANSIYQQHSGSMNLGEWTGWPSFAHGSGYSLTQVDYLRQADVQLCDLARLVEQLANEVAALKPPQATEDGA